MNTKLETCERCKGEGCRKCGDTGYELDPYFTTPRKVTTIRREANA